MFHGTSYAAALPAAKIARALRGTRSGEGWLVRCVAHDDDRPSLSIADGHDGRLLVHCFAGCNPRDVLAALCHLGLYNSSGLVAPYCAPHVREAGREALAWSARADRIWQASVPLIGTPAETYLQSRKCLIPACADLRFLPAVGRMTYPAMIGRITDAVTGQPLSLHFTLLMQNGSGKAPVERPKLLMKGHRKAGGVIRLCDDVGMTRGLGITEGIENALACMAMGWRPVWAAIDAGNVAQFPVLAGIECLTIFADHDKAGLDAARKCAGRWQAAEREARIVPPSTAGNDWADVIIEESL
jgi:putative DNA primase/helicase